MEHTCVTLTMYNSEHVDEHVSLNVTETCVWLSMHACMAVHMCKGTHLVEPLDLPLLVVPLPGEWSQLLLQSLDLLPQLLSLSRPMLLVRLWGTDNSAWCGQGRSLCQPPRHGSARGLGDPQRVRQHSGHTQWREQARELQPGPSSTGRMEKQKLGGGPVLSPNSQPDHLLFKQIRTRKGAKKESKARDTQVWGKWPTVLGTGVGVGGGNMAHSPGAVGGQAALPRAHAQVRGPMASLASSISILDLARRSLRSKSRCFCSRSASSSVTCFCTAASF